MFSRAFGESAFDLVKKLVHLLAHRVLPYRTAAHHFHEPLLFGKFPDTFFINVYQRAYNRHPILLHVQFREVSRKFSFVQKVHQDRLSIVVAVMPESHRLDPQTFGLPNNKPRLSREQL